MQFHSSQSDSSNGGNRFTADTMMSSFSDEESEPLVSAKEARYHDHVQYDSVSWFSVCTALCRMNLYRMIPAFGWMRDYTKSMFVSDVFSGLTVGCFTVPQAVAYSFIAGVPPIVALLTAAIPSLVYAFIGTSSHLNIGPDAVVCLMAGNFIREMIVRQTDDGSSAQMISDPTVVMPYMTIFTIVVGMFLLVLGVLGLGFLDSVLSSSVIDGLIISIVSTIIISQLPAALGIAACSGIDCPASPVTKLWYVQKHITDIHWYTFIFAASTLLLLIVLTYMKNGCKMPIFPSVLVVLMIAVTVSVLTKAGDHSVSILGSVDVQQHWPALPRKAFLVFQHSLRPAMSIVAIVFIKANVIARKYAQKHGTVVDANQELVALGLSNIVGAVAGGMVSSGCIGRSNLGSLAGTRSQVANMVAAILCLLAIVLLPLLSQLPFCVLSALIIHTVFGMYSSHFASMKKALAIGAYSDFGVCCAIIVVALLDDVETGQIVGFAGSATLLVKRAGIISVQLLGVKNIYNEESWMNVEIVDVLTKQKEDQQIQIPSGIAMLRVHGSLHFGTINFFKTVCENAIDITRVSKEDTVYTLIHSHGSDDFEENVRQYSKQFYTASSAQAKLWNEKKAPLQALILDFSLVPFIDVTALIGLLELTKFWITQGASVVLVVPQTTRRENRRHFIEYRKQHDQNSTSNSSDEITTVPTPQQQHAYDVLTRLPDAFLPALLPAKLRKAIESLTTLIQLSPTKELPTLALGGVFDDLGHDAVVDSIEEALVQLHQRGVISNPPVQEKKKHV